jgi:tetratricopeptide (TPR) repeat protein
MEAYWQLGVFEQARGEPARAIELYVEGLRHGSFDRRIARRLAWTLATSRDPGLRNGRQAVALAEHLCTLELFREPASLDVLAAAYAEYGDFERALAVARRAAVLARHEGDAALARAIEGRITGYESDQPYRG